MKFIRMHGHAALRPNNEMGRKTAGWGKRLAIV
jgi:hypothetical protein